MYTEAIIHYPTNENALKFISKELAAFRCVVTIRYIEALKLSDEQIDILIKSLDEEITSDRKKNSV